MSLYFNVCTSKMDESTHAPWIIDTGTSYYILHSPYLYTEIILSVGSKVVLPNEERLYMSYIWVARLND